jgi:hypothetical protein
MLNYFNLDLHISVIADVKYILKDRINIVDWSLSGHTWVMNSLPTNVKIINTSSWINININMIDEFQKTYDTFLKSFDGFIVGHPNIFVMLYEKYNKPIIMINSCRYDMPTCFTKNRSIIPELNNCLLRLESKGLLTIISNNLADRDYLKLSIPQLKISHIPSLCLYTGITYTPTHTQFLLYSGENCIESHPLIKKRSEIGRFNWSELGKFKGIIHIPYEASTMSIFEHISAGIPLFFPTKRFLKELWETKKAHFQCNYWGETPEYLNITKSYDFWLDRADYYNLKGYYYFDSFAQLFETLNTFEDINRLERLYFLESRKNSILEFWKSLKLDGNSLSSSTDKIHMKSFLLKLGL